MTVDQDRAQGDLAFLEDLLRRTSERVDPHAFHYVHWGWIVLVWYPLANVFQLTGRASWQLPLGIAAVLLGFTLSAVRERRLVRSPRVVGEDTHVSRQLALVTAANIGAGFLLSAFGPATGWIAGPDVPIVWGLVYANLAFTTGVVYRRDFLPWAAVILAGTVLAMLLRDYQGLILGAAMGVGMIVPGLAAERRVRALAA